ncbi:MAG: hypothetical protein ACT6S0_04745 [Roseateles sp.]|uniref:hypothetical protein n=1 Tax=Roseateles sp. TaxID=1971397 RepID=UPI0040373ED0
MPELIVSRNTVATLYADASKEMTHDDAVLHVAGITGQTPETVEGVIWARESNHTAAMECGA